MSTFTLTLADETADEVEPEPEVPADDTADEVEPEPEAPTDDAITGAGLTLVSGEVKASSWYQRIALTLTNHYSQSVDINQLKLGFTATAHPDPYSPFSGTMLGNQAVTLASDGGWPIEKIPSQSITTASICWLPVNRRCWSFIFRPRKRPSRLAI